MHTMNAVENKIVARLIQQTIFSCLNNLAKGSTIWCNAMVRFGVLHDNGCEDAIIFVMYIKITCWSS